MKGSLWCRIRSKNRGKSNFSLLYIPMMNNFTYIDIVYRSTHCCARAQTQTDSPACRAACAVPGANDGVIQLTDWSGMVISPNYSSQSYPDLQNCTWSIRVSAGSKVKVKVDMFDLEEGVYIDRSPENEKLCYDYVTVSLCYLKCTYIN